jgi:hypothetical protein
MKPETDMKTVFAILAGSLIVAAAILGTRLMGGYQIAAGVDKSDCVASRDADRRA